MNESDRKRLEQLMAHYNLPMNQSMKKLLDERKLHEHGILPLPEWRQDIKLDRKKEEWEGPFFCEIIAELLHDS